LAAGIPNARLVVLTGFGHVPHREDPDKFAALVGDFLARE
jgi:pimeloyl-ACP methyl ester carboxylesterase